MIRALLPQLSRTSLMAIALTVTACVDAPTRPQLSARGLTANLNVGTGAQTAKLYPNTLKYRDAGAKPATGRSGAASLEVRALVDKNHQTTLEVTTGSLEGGQTPPGKLDKVQVKLFDRQWNQLSTRNYSGLSGGGYAQYPLTGLVRGSGLQVQANVSGIDPNRTDVVTVRETVKLRPDLAATAITGPTRAQLGVPVQIFGSVRELNGDVGARADCVLSVDGVPSAYAQGIWVDASGDVSCMFSLAFSSAGTRTLELSVVNVAPGDYDPANNSRTSTIVVERGTIGFSWFAEATEWTESFDFVFDWLTRDVQDGLTFTHEEHWDAKQSDDFQNGLMFGNLDREIAFPLRNVQFSNSTDGNVLAAKNFGTLEPTFFQDDELVRLACVNYFTSLEGNQGFVQVGVCSGVLRYAGGAPVSFINLHRQKSEALYVAIEASGRNTYEYSDGRDPETFPFSYVYNFEQPRALPHYGSDLTIDFSFEAGGELFRQTAAIPMTAFERVVPNTPHNCSEYTKPASLHDYEKVCSSRSNWRMWGVEGRLTGTGTVEPAPGALTP